MHTPKNQWPAAFGWSLLCHGALLGIATLMLLVFPPAEIKTEPIEVDLVADAGGGGGGGGSEAKAEELPEIHKAKASPTLPPPPPQEAEEEAENDVHDIAETAEDTTSDDGVSEEGTTSETASEDSGGSGSGSGGGNGSGIGTGNGSGYGPGSGSGSGGGSGPQILSQTEPSYPESARRAGITGTTVVGMTISSDGSVTSAWVESSSGNGELDDAAVNAVYSWRFVPAKQNGMAITVNSRVPITFRLH